MTGAGDRETAQSSRSQRIEKIRSEFERAWTSGQRVRIEDLVAEAPECDREELFRALIVTEIRLQEISMALLDPGAYHRRFPQFRDAIESIFNAMGTSSTIYQSLSLMSTIDNGEEAAKSEPELQKVGRYRIESLLGRGSFGRVFLARDEELDRHVAVKVPHQHLVATPADIDRYLAEAQILASLDHPGIVPVYDVGRLDDGLCYVVSKYIRGESLAERLVKDRPAPVQAARWVASIAEALQHAHSNNLVHRDIKPANILLDQDERPYVTDFGLALRESDWCLESEIIGTPIYMSPEQARGEGHMVDGRADIFSLSVVLYELLTGKRPFHATSRDDLLNLIQFQEARPPRQFDEAIPRELERICLKGLHKRVSDRYSAAVDLARDLNEWLLGELEASQPRPTSPAKERVAPPTEVPAPKIVPKGLRSFDGHDAEFFLELLPGPRDRYGIPDSIRFWKSALEETDPDRTFRIGLIYGPSGCGKSSFVKAGLQPLFSENILPIYLEATPTDTEVRLSRGLAKACPSLRDDLYLVDALQQVRRGPTPPRGKKLLLILDQFEQWLQGRDDLAREELVLALRQCDGVRVQCLVMVRDDFWMAATRFMHEVEVPLIERVNSAAIDLFDLPHARRVLAEFGKAYGRLPQNLGESAPGQLQFLDEAVKDLEENGYVIPVRLSLFAEMIKGREWSSGTLKALGGTEGIGVKFLEETFSSPHAPPAHRLHQRAIRAVLSALLPAEGGDIKGAMCPREVLLEAAQYAHRTREFEEVLKLLSQLRLISPTDPESASFDGIDSKVQSGSQEGYFQLTHDFLVPAVREWLNQKRRETRRGRALLLLEQREREWAPTKKPRLLPSLSEWFQMTALTASGQRTLGQQRMLRQAFLYHTRRLALLGSIIAIIALVMVGLLPPETPAPTQYQLMETYFHAEAAPEVRRTAFDQLRLRDTAVFPRVLENTKSIRDPGLLLYAIPRIVEVANTKELGDEAPKYDAAISRPIQDFLKAFWEHESEEVRQLAFSKYCQISKPDDALLAIRDAANHSPRNMQALMADYIRSLPDPDLRKSANILLEILHDHRIQKSQEKDLPLLEAAVAALDRIPPKELLETGSSQFGAANELLSEYISEAVPEKVQTLGAIVEELLVTQVPADILSHPLTSKSLFLIELLGEIKKRSRELRLNATYGEGLERVYDILVQHQDLNDSELDSIVGSFHQLNDQGQRPITPLKRILANPSEKWISKVTTARLLGESGDVDSLNLLCDLAKSEMTFLNLREQCLISIGRIGEMSEPKTRQQAHDYLLDFLTQLAPHRSEAPVAVKNAALRSFGSVSDGKQADILFSFLITPENPLERIDIAVTETLYDILSRHPSRTGPIVNSYLNWYEIWYQSNSELRRFIDPDTWMQMGNSFLPRDSKEQITKKIVLSLGDVILEHRRGGEISEGERICQHAYALIKQFVGSDERIVPVGVLTMSLSDLENWRTALEIEIRNAEYRGGVLTPILRETDNLVP